MLATASVYSCAVMATSSNIQNLEDDAMGFVEQLTYTTNTALPSKKATVLLIGSTGNGKSTLGNYLLNPKEGVSKAFATGRSNLPETQHVQCKDSMFTGPDVEALGYSSVHLTVIDTPGLNESDAADLEHTIGIIKKLDEVKEITACILVVKFSLKIDKQYRKTVEYYSRLLPSLFEKNVVIVMTEYTTDDRSVSARKQGNIDEEAIEDNTKQEIVRYAKLCYNNPILFKLDCLHHIYNDQQFHFEIRNDIISYILQLEPIKTINMMVAKTEYLLKKDAERVKCHEEEVNGYKKRLIEMKADSEAALNSIQDRSQEVVKLETKINNISSELEEIECPELVTTEAWSVHTKSTCKFWKGAQSIECNISSKFKIANVRLWNNKRTKWIDIEQSDYNFKGNVKGRFLSGLYASVTLETEKKTKHEGRIAQLKEEKEDARIKLSIRQKELQEYRDEQYKHRQAITLFEKYIEAQNVKIIELNKIHMTIPEANKRLHEIYI